MTCPDCGSSRWADVRRCYYHAKVKVGLFTTSFPSVDGFTEAELTLVGVLPEWEPDPRARPVTTLLEASSRWAEEQEARLRGVRWLADLGGERLELNA